MSGPVTGARALALGAIESGVALVTGYPGSPATGVVNAILKLTQADQVQVEWTSNEKAAMEIAFGASLGGKRAMLCVKSVGLNIALDPLMTINLSGCNAGFVILVGDDPGGWGSQNEQDSRALAALIDLPWLEPTTVPDAYAAIQQAFALSEEMGLPVIVRITRALALAEAEIQSTRKQRDSGAGIDGYLRPAAFQREFMRWVVLPINVVPYRQRLGQRLNTIRQRFELSPLNGVDGDGRYGVIAAGFAYQKLFQLFGGLIPTELKILRLGTFYPIPSDLINSFLRTVESALVVEETYPLVEKMVRASAQSAGLTLPVFGRDTGHLSQTGEIFAPDLALALNRLVPGLGLPVQGAHSRPRPSREPLCEGCPYVPTFDALEKVMTDSGGRDTFIVVGDPGCMVRSQLPPYHLLDVKHGLGSSIGMAAGIVASQRDTGKRVIALAGDSGFLHTGLNGLVDAARMGTRMLVLILDNGSTALSGGQPHPASRTDARGRARQPVDLAALARAAGAGMVCEVDLDRGEDIRGPITKGLSFHGLAVVISRGQCIREM